MSNLVYLHVGLHKTGTTYLQSYFHVNRDGLRSLGVEYPGGPGQVSQVLAAYDLRGRRGRGYRDTRISGQWKLLAEHILTSPAPVALVSHEGLALATLREARKAVASFGDAEVRVIVTARDLARTIVSLWQEEIKADRTWTWREYCDAIKDADRATTRPAFGFWRREDLPRICDTWAAAAGEEQIHLVTVPPPGSDATELLQRVASVVGFDHRLLTNEPARDNEMIGVAGIEVLRQLNARLGGRLNEAQYARTVKGALVPMLACSGPQVRVGLPESELAWVADRSNTMIQAIRSRRYQVTGDLDDLLPRAQPGLRSPDDASDPELFEAAVDALAQLAELHTTSWWVRRRRKIENEPELADRASRRRERFYSVKVKLLELGGPQQFRLPGAGCCASSGGSHTREGSQSQ